ncbi:unnamed protein product [Rotaria sordida]|uniref:Uncharacterized protein n=1 Tax=Rotaria sordida TaxID=392033 RepID=A0A815FX24_9BILA|nr:unnamed protein product [Rotaria sordida]CAF1297305.1 unnamed protein product [Rotaria sordida]CAF1331023.1 unnamed protein product [Rotaria sordida]CAF3760559.1 unnamed protein product [Rotaria sordida]CAF3843689.1 unnamed protein product [Rotaria sordida]
MVYTFNYILVKKEIHEGEPHQIKKSDLNELFSLENGWTIESIEDFIYESTSASPFGLDGRTYLSLIRHNKNIKY